LPYGVKCQVQEDEYIYIGTLCRIEVDNKNGHLLDFVETISGLDCQVYLTEVKPYLFPLSSMTEEQEEELITITNGKFRYMWGDINNAIPRKNTSEWGISENAFINGIEVINILYTWLLKNHFDINGLIPIGLANDATRLNIY
jgi:hypothetical protein